MIGRAIAITVTLAAAATFAACSSAPTTRQQVCDAYNTLRQEMLTGDLLSNGQIFTQAGTLSDLASRYSGPIDLSANAAELKAISQSSSTTELAVINATDEIIDLCDAGYIGSN